MIVGIVANGQVGLIPDLTIYKDEVDYWIGADRGSLQILKAQLPLHYAIGDFDSIDHNELEIVQQATQNFKQYPTIKNETDLELAIEQAFEIRPVKIYLFGVTGGRLDHTLANIQLLHRIVNQNIEATIIDCNNQLCLTKPGAHTVVKDSQYPIISFIPQTEKVIGLTLEGFAYPLYKQDIYWGQTRCISNYLLEEYGTYSYEGGILLHIKSRDI